MVGVLLFDSSIPYSVCPQVLQTASTARMPYTIVVLLTSSLVARPARDSHACMVSRRAALTAAFSHPAILTATAAHAAQQLTFETKASGLRVADIKPGSGDAVAPDSRVTFHVKGRLVGKQGWVFMDTQADDEPLRLTMGVDHMIPGLAEGLLGMRKGGTRRLVVPSSLGYTDRNREPLPRSFGQRQRLFTTVLNQNRISQESIGMGAGNDVAGKVALDQQLINVRPPR